MRDPGGALSDLRQAWMMGTKASAPEDWRALFSGAAPTDLDLVALAGQALQFAYVPQQSGALKFEARLPVLNAPQLDPAQRVLFRRAIERMEKDGRDGDSVVWLAASRGYVAHPLDWMPASTHMSVPSFYLPWQAWMERIQARAEGETISAESWSDWSWSERRSAAAALRASDPAAGRDLIAAVAAKEPADKRLELVELFWRGLSEDDAPFLESLSHDRSDKVKAAAALLVSRARRSTAPTEVETELAGFFSVKTKGILSKSKSVEANALKTDAQRKRRSELMDMAQLSAFAAALGLGEVELIETWNYKQAEEIEDSFVWVIMRSGSQEAVASLIEAQKKTIVLNAHTYARLIHRAPEQDQLAMRLRLFSELHPEVYAFEKMCLPACGFLPQAMIATSPEWKILKSENKDAKGENDAADYGLISKAATLGLVASQDAAAWIISELANPAYPPTHPVFDVLHFNASLKGLAPP